MRLIKILLIAILIMFNQLAFGQENFMTDSRDSKVYKIRKIGSQVWMTQNLAKSKKIIINEIEKSHALSVRCVKDYEQ